MDWEGKVESPKLVCAVSGEALAPGSPFFSTLLFHEGHFVRRDFSPAAWPGQDQAAFISWWKQRVPDEEGGKPKPVDAEALRRMFEALKDSTERPQQCFAYVVLLFLVRARKMRFRDSLREGGRSYLLVEDRALRCVYKVRDPEMTPDEEQRVQRNLMEVIELGAPPAP
jgi:hypothetical protein